jgi:signal transduction histidine kinase
VSLRFRIAAAFAVLAFVLSTTLAVVTYQFCRRYLIEKRESGATRQALIDAGLAARGLDDPNPQIPELPTVGSPVTFGALLRIGDAWYGANAGEAARQIPLSVMELADAGKVGRQRAAFGDATSLFVAVPIPDSDAVYVEIFGLSELERSLSTIAWVVTFGAIATTVLGALLGIGASRLVMRPLRAVSAAAEDVAAGDLDRRLEPTGDADLQPIVASFNHMAAALEARIDRETRFASDVSHELRTPLTAMHAALEVLDKRVTDDGRRVFEVLREQCERFERLVLDLLEISRFDSGHQELVLERVDPRLVIETTLRNNGHADVPLECEPSTPETCDLDKRRVEQILANLLTNADLHAGGATRVGLSGVDGRLRVAIEDAGPGIPEEERALIFERFHRGRTAARDTGTGLGLSIVAEHCRVHGGRLWSEPRPGGGTRFVVDLPARAS